MGKLEMDRLVVMSSGLVLLLTVLAHASQDPAGKMELKHENEVFLMTDKNFHHIVNSHEIVLVLFYVPWNNAYRSILPEFEKAAKKLAVETPSVVLGRLDTSLYYELAAEVDIGGDSLQYLYYHLGKPYNFVDFENGEKLIKILQERSQIMFSPPRPHPELVAELTQHEFERTLKATDFAVVAFYKENCPACVRLLLEYETAVVNLTDVPKARFFKTNIETNLDAELVKKYQIYDLPVLKIFRNGKMFEFNSENKVMSDILQFIKKRLLPPYKDYATLEQAEGWTRSYPNKAAVIGVFEKTDSSKFELFTEIANYFRDEYNFAWVKKAAPASDQGTQGRPGIFTEGTIAVYPPFRHISPGDKKIYIFTEEAPTFEKLSQFIKTKALPKVGQRTMKNKDTTYATLPLFIGYLKINWTKDIDDDTTFHRNKIAQMVGVSKELTFTISDRREFKHELARMGLDKHAEELLIGIIGKNGEYYPGPVVEMMNLKILTDFAQDYLKSKLKPYHRTQSPPTSDENDDYPVKTVVGATFRKLILRHDKSVALVAHRPQCPLCRTAVAVLTDLSEDRSLYPGLTYASMDMLANDPPARFVPKTYPTLFVIPPDKKERHIVYQGKNFTKAAIMEFLDAHVANYRIKTEL